LSLRSKPLNGNALAKFILLLLPRVRRVVGLALFQAAISNWQLAISSCYLNLIVNYTPAFAPGGKR
jgi:hypothetical protein